MTDVSARLDNLETKIAFQEQALEELSQSIVSQWNKIDQLQGRISDLENRLREAQAAAGRDPQDEPPPPHW